MDLESALQILTEKSRGECGESQNEIEVAEVVLTYIKQLEVENGSRTEK
jgi:hypothetical protein